MKNKKLLKVVAAAVLCSSMAMTAIGFTACDTENGGGHKHHYVWQDDENGSTHHQHCGVDGCNEPDKPSESHSWAGDRCSKCGATKPNGGSGALVPEYKGPGPALTEGSEEVTYSFLASDVPTGAVSEEWSNGVFSVPKGSTTRTRNGSINSKKYTQSVQMKDDNCAIVLHASAAGELILHLQNGSSSATSAGVLINGKDTEYPKSGVQELKVTIEAAGDYTIKRNSSRNGTTDVFYAEFNATLDNTPIESIEVVNKGKSDYLLTQWVDCREIKINAKHKDTGKISEVSLDNVEFDTSNYNPQVSGTYNIGVKYTVEGNLSSEIKEFTATYPVKVYTVSSIKLDTTLTDNEKQTTLKQAYLPNEQLDTTGLTVTATGTLGADEAVFVMKKTDYSVSADLTAEGEKDVTVGVSSAFTGADALNVSYKVIVKAKKEPVSNEVSLTVGESGEFKTVTQALSYIQACNYDNNVIKTVNIADGQYKEKISVDIPNVHFVGSATNTPDAATDNGVVLWYDAASGLNDPSGRPYGTKGSSSVTVTKNATGFKAENITFKNYYNNSTLYYELKAKTNDTQGVALMVEADGAVFTNCKMTGYQDTLYANKGTQFYNRCWIEGRTDYIFGADAIPYFYKCTIHTVSAGAKDGDGGYIVAYKNTSDAYGPVFNNCALTGAAEGATNIALGRAWGKECHIVIMNSEISANYSKAAHTAGTEKAQRYVTMSKNDPKPEYMIEYNNTGDGAISESLANTCTVIAEANAAMVDKYQIANVATLLGFNPGTFE